MNAITNSYEAPGRAISVELDPFLAQLDCDGLVGQVMVHALKLDFELCVARIDPGFNCFGIYRHVDWFGYRVNITKMGEL